MALEKKAKNSESLNIYSHGFYVMVEGLLVLPFVSLVVLDRRMFGCYFSVLATLAKGAKRGEFWVKWGKSRTLEA